MVSRVGLLLRLCAVAALLAAGFGRASGPSGERIELAGTVPVASEVDGLGLSATHEVWLAMIGASERTLDVAQFYVSNNEGGRLEPVLAAVEAAAARGVRVRVLADEKFYGTYPESLERLAARDGITMRRLDLSQPADGVLHAKYFVVDGREVFLGSPNFDWRSLEHIQELGVRTDCSAVARAMESVFEYDWALAGGGDPPAARQGEGPLSGVADFGGVEHRVTPVASPEGLLPDPRLWDLPRIVALIEGAEERVRVQLLSYKAAHRDKRYFGELESALRAAAARGVEVQMILSHWSKSRASIVGLQSLQCLPHVEVRIVTVPEHPDGFIPFARVVHSKYMVVDGRRSWVGTSNWSGDYFHASRNVGVIVEGGPFGALLDRYFEAGWDGPYAEVVDPCKEYEAPRVAR